MAVTILASPVAPNLPPVTRMRTFVFTFTGSYTAPGEAITAANLGMSLLYNVQLTKSPLGYVVNMIATTPSTADGSFAAFVLGWQDGTGAQVANGAYPAPITGGNVYALVLGR